MMTFQKFLTLSLLVVCHVLVSFGQQVVQRANVRDQQQPNNRQLGLYPRVGKRSPGFEVMRRGDLLNLLADNWQRTGSLMDNFHDMTESKRSASTTYVEGNKPVKVRSQAALVFPGPRVGRSDPDFQGFGNDPEEIVKKWAAARVGKKWAAARVGKKSVEDQLQQIEEPEKRVPFARVG